MVTQIITRWKDLQSLTPIKEKDLNSTARVIIYLDESTYDEKNDPDRVMPSADHEEISKKAQADFEQKNTISLEDFKKLHWYG